MILRSKIKNLFSEETIKLLASICDTRRIDSAHEKMRMVQQLLKRNGIMFYTLGGATNRLALMIGGYTVKFALDRQGYKDNLMEYALSKELQPWVTKTYETNGYIVVAECVKLMTREEWHLRKSDILKVLETLSQDYLLGDVGYIKKNYTNWGVRDDGSVVILDYAYCHRATENLFTCEVCGSGILRYDSTFSFLKCNNATVCTAKYDYTERKLIQGDTVDWEMIDEVKQDSLSVPVGSATVEVVDRDGIFKKGNIRVVETPEEFYEYLRRKQKMGRNFNEDEVLKLTILAFHEKDQKKKKEIEDQIAELMKSDDEVDGIETEVDWDNLSDAVLYGNREEEEDEEETDHVCDADYADSVDDLLSSLRKKRNNPEILVGDDTEPEGVEVPEGVEISGKNINVNDDIYEDILGGVEVGGDTEIDIPVTDKPAEPEKVQEPKPEPVESTPVETTVTAEVVVEETVVQEGSEESGEEVPEEVSGTDEEYYPDDNQYEEPGIYINGDHVSE